MKRGKIFNTNVVAPINHAVGKKCRKIFLPGNHKARLQKFLWTHPELFSLRDLELRNVLKLSNYGIEYAAYSVQFGDVLEVSHGTRVNKWAGMSAKAEQELRRYSMSTITGHVHRSGFIVGGKSPRLHTRGHAVIYKNGVMVHDPHPSGDGLFEIEEVYIIERNAQGM